MFRYNMILLTNKPTRVTRHSANARDSIFTNSATNHNDFKSAVIKTDLSDYFPIFFELETNETIQKPVVKSTYKRSYCEKNIEKFENTLHNRTWDDIKKLKTPIKCINTFAISLLTFMTSRSQKPRLKLNSRAIRALGLLKVLQNHHKRNKVFMKNS